MFLSLRLHSGNQEAPYLVDRDAEVEALCAAYCRKVYCHEVSVGVHDRAAAGALKDRYGVEEAVLVRLLRYLSASQLGLDSLCG